MGSEARSALGLGVLFLLAFWAKGLERPRLAEGTPAGATEQLAILAVGKGALLPPAKLSGGNEELDDAILVGDLILKNRDRRVGLRVATLAPGLEFEAFESLDVADSEGALDRFLDLVDRQRAGSVIVLASYGTIRPADGGAKELAHALRRLGAESDPLAPGASWAMISVHTSEGWVKLAEAHSPTQGVALSFIVNRDADSYLGYEGDVFSNDRSRPAEVQLEGELSSATVSADGVKRLRKTWIGGVARANVSAPLRLTTKGAPRPASAQWSDVSLPEGTVFRTELGIELDAGAKSGGVVFSVLVDGSELASRTLRAGADAGSWHPWEVDLSGFSAKRVDLELRVTPEGGTTGQAHWGAPILAYPPRR